ncbi:phospholipase D-like domain-containing protein DpdK [Nocardia cyriacigeorgica]|uniref:phospholipase D-like domain-containing protein DpdK n=1 Tax=Nocardia cyriacigeorgica TaxID=135487 RepID=UPI002B4ACE66|nr:phospholipase D-like domain-containing protein DpdK [Nocardia cyriacigeorgica]
MTVPAQRTIRTRPRNGLAIFDVLSGVLLSELCLPSSEIWLVTGWVSDTLVLDNSAHRFDDLLGDDAPSELYLSDVLVELARRGANVHVAVREVDHNIAFLRRLENRGVPINTHSSPDLHEKLLVGDDWVMKGSMNFTWNGLQRNEESIDLLVGSPAAARERLELQTRWIGGHT